MSTSIPSGLQSEVEIAVADLSARLDVPPEAVSVDSAEAVTWPDRALGCPRPGMAYPQVQVDGARIVLRVGTASYAYHCGGGRGPFLCTEQGPAR